VKSRDVNRVLAALCLLVAGLGMAAVLIISLRGDGAPQIATAPPATTTTTTTPPTSQRDIAAPSGVATVYRSAVECSIEQLELDLNRTGALSGHPNPERTAEAFGRAHYGCVDFSI
jgi:hypothetical protein